MKVSVLIVNHNGERHLERCLASLESESPFEILLADNASGDGSVELVKRRFPEVRVLELGGNYGFGAANNRAAEQASGDLLLLLNNDAWLAEGALSVLVERFAGEPRLGLVAPQLRYPDGRLQTVWAPDVSVFGEAVRKATNRFEGRSFHHGALSKALRTFGAGWYSAACALLRREAFEAVGGFDERYFLYFEDADLCLRLRQAGWRLVEERSVVAFHEKGASASPVVQERERDKEPARRAEVESRRSQLLYYRKHRPAWERRWLRNHLRRKYKQANDLEVQTRVLAAVAEDEASG